MNFVKIWSFCITFAFVIISRGDDTCKTLVMQILVTKHSLHFSVNFTFIGFQLLTGNGLCHSHSMHFKVTVTNAVIQIHCTSSVEASLL